MDITPEQMAWLAIVAALLAVAAQLKWVKALSGRNRDKARYGFGAICVILLYMGGATVIQGWLTPAPSGGGGGGGGSGGGVPVITPTACGAACPTAGSTNVSLTLQNTLDTSTTTEFNATVLCTSSGGSISLTETDGEQSGTNFNCGQEYLCKVLSTSGAAGDSSKVVSVLAGVGASVTADNDLKFTACSAKQSLQIGGELHGVLQTKVFDVEENGWVYAASGSTVAGSWNSTDGVVYRSTTGKTTNWTMSTGANIEFKYLLQPTASYENYNDRGVLVLINAATSKWDVTKTVCKVNGQTAANIKGSGLNEDEVIAYADYEYAYLIPMSSNIVSPAWAEVQCSMTAAAGVDPSGTTIDVDFTPRGQYASTTNALIYKIGAVKDDATKTQVYTLHDTSISFA